MVLLDSSFSRYRFASISGIGVAFFGTFPALASPTVAIPSPYLMWMQRRHWLSRASWRPPVYRRHVMA